MTNQQVLQKAAADMKTFERHADDGKWFEYLIAAVGPLVRHWDLDAVWPWHEWPQRIDVLGEAAPATDPSIDLVGRTRDGGWVAIQAKARPWAHKLTFREIEPFSESSKREVWKYRWIVTTCDAGPQLASRLGSMAPGRRPVRCLNAVRHVRQALQQIVDVNGDPRTVAQDEAVEAALEGLKEHRGQHSGGRVEAWDPDEARGRIIMPCGTGKTRVGYRIAAALAADRASGDALVVVLAPSIGLIHQLRSAWMELAASDGRRITALSVCSDRPRLTKVEARRVEERASLDVDPTADLSRLDASELVGDLARDADGVSTWLGKQLAPELAEGWPVIFSTYQSSARVGEALVSNDLRALLIVADEAHRTAGLKAVPQQDAKVRDFTVCHRSALMPALNRIYMTATPRTFARGGPLRNERFVVKSMDHEATFGPELHRLSYRRAVDDGLLSDYRIIAVVPDSEVREHADRLAERRRSELGGGTGTPKSQRMFDRRVSTDLAVRQLAYGLAAFGGIACPDGADSVRLRSSLAFSNRCDHSADAASALADESVRAWLQRRVGEMGRHVSLPEFAHRDSTYPTAEREDALLSLQNATEERPFGVLNVGIFGEGIDTPALSAVAFLEERKSPVEVIQAVGRVMRLSPDKSVGYVVVPLPIPAGQDVEAWLESREKNGAYGALGQILQALRAHDGRIEDRLGDLMTIYQRAENGSAKSTITYVAVVHDENGTQGYVVKGPPRVIEDGIAARDGERSAPDLLRDKAASIVKVEDAPPLESKPAATFIVDSVSRGRRGIRIAPVDVDASWRRDEETGRFPLVPAVKAAADKLHDAQRERPNSKVRLRDPVSTSELRRTAGGDQNGGDPVPQGMMLPLGLAESLQMRVLQNSGLNRGPVRDANVIQELVERAGSTLREDGLEDELAQILEMDKLGPPPATGHRADACTVAALLLTMAGIVQTRLEEAGAVEPRPDLSVRALASAADAAAAFADAYGAILDRDYQPIFGLVRDLLVELRRRVGPRANLNAALRTVAAEVGDVADTYAERGADYAGELFTKVMGDQKSDGAYFTRRLAGRLLGALAVEAATDGQDKPGAAAARLKVFDPACGSGGLLMGWLEAVKHRIRREGGSDAEYARKAVEDMLVGLDVNPVSLQLAGAQFLVGDPGASWSAMQLHRMPYADTGQGASAGSLELLARPQVFGAAVPAATGQEVLDLSDPAESADRPLPGPALDAALTADVVLANPPFVTREKLGEKYGPVGQKAIRTRIDEVHDLTKRWLPQWADICGKTTTRPLYVLLAMLCRSRQSSAIGTVMPMAGLLGPDGRSERIYFATEMYIRWIITCHEPGEINLSESSVNESLVVATRKGAGTDLPTRFVSLDRFPRTPDEAEEIVAALARGDAPPCGQIRDVAARRVRAGDWSAAAWRNLDIDGAAEWIDGSDRLQRFADISGVSMHAPGDGAGKRVQDDSPFDLWFYQSKAQSAHLTIAAEPDTPVRLHRAKNPAKLVAEWNRDVRAPLLITAGQRPGTARLCALVDEAHPSGGVGTRWKPVQGVSRSAAGALAVWLNSTLGRIDLLRWRGRTLEYALFTPDGMMNVHVPRLDDAHGLNVLHAAYRETGRLPVPLYRDGRTPIRETWDDAVSVALGIDRAQLARWADLLASEPSVSPAAFWRTRRTTATAAD